MTKEQKQLLLKDLCARLPYEVQVAEDNEWIGTLMSLDPFDLNYTSVYVKLKGSEKQRSYFPSEIKPYLRPMSSMTKGEMDEYNDIWEIDRRDILTVGEELANDYKNKGYESIWEHPVVPLYRYIDWLNQHYFDYRGLISKGLALEAPEGMYNTGD